MRDSIPDNVAKASRPTLNLQRTWQEALFTLCRQAAKVGLPTLSPQQAIIAKQMNLKKSLLLITPLLVAACVLTLYLFVMYGEPITRETWSGAVEHCAYVGVEEGGDGFPDLLSYSPCGTIEQDGTLHIPQALLQRIVFIPEEPSCLMSGGRVFYITRSGQTREVYSLDMGCDPFSEGMTRSPSPQGTRFIDKSLNVVISTPYQYALPFEDGLAVVCNELRHRREWFDEHWEYVGGNCGYIDRAGKLVVPLRYTMHEVAAHRPDTQR